MDPITQLRLDLRRSLHGPAWHGPALDEVLARVTAAEAAAHPLPGCHSVWEIALHATGWMEEVARRLAGGVPALPARGDWPGPLAVSEAAWMEARADLARAMELLDVTLASFDASRLFRPVGGEDEVTYVDMLSGVAQHNAYHAGQVSLLTRALRRADADSSPSPPLAF